MVDLKNNATFGTIVIFVTSACIIICSDSVPFKKRQSTNTAKIVSTARHSYVCQRNYKAFTTCLRGRFKLLANKNRCETNK